jgi:hypothetical protein
MARGWDGIFFLLDGKEFAFRSWERVPRVGDWVVFPAPDRTFEVARVIWRETVSTNVPYVEVVLVAVGTSHE